MNRLGLGIAALALGAASACGGSSESAEPGVKESATPVREDLGNISSVVELRDALIEAGYDCPNWDQSNIVDLAAESGSCSDSDVLSTFASQGNLQDQLDTSRGMDQLSIDAGLESDPSLVGPNWIFRSPDADAYAEQLGGTIVGPPS